MSGNGSRYLAWFIRPRQAKPGSAPVVPASTELPDPPAPAKAIAPSEFVVLAARHLDPEEGVMRSGHVVTESDESAVRTVIRYVAERNRER